MNGNIQPIIPSKTIIKATLIAFVIASIIVLIAVLPAEYGIDPVGAGKTLGFSKLYRTEEKLEKVEQSVINKKILKLENAGSKPEVPTPKEANNPAPIKQFDEREDEVVITVPAGKGLEYKVSLLKYGKMKYEWITDTDVFFDFHGEVYEEKPSEPVFYESYTVAYSNNMVGTFLSPFHGRHGWYFKNYGTVDKTIKLRLKGQYQLIAKK